MRVLTAGASPAQSQDDLPKQLGMQAIQELLAGCVREWDATGSPEGADPAGTLQDTVGGVGATLHIKVSEAVFDKMGFQAALAQCPGASDQKGQHDRQRLGTRSSLCLCRAVCMWLTRTPIK